MIVWIFRSYGKYGYPAGCESERCARELSGYDPRRRSGPVIAGCGESISVFLLPRIQAPPSPFGPMPVLPTCSTVEVVPPNDHLLPGRNAMKKRVFGNL
ncbi:MAG: hypothetical protein D5R96_05530 [Methanocalculus sp. MSAO_Arc2]|nr:MAG: hypothetical protein D5R96_05530 [Methanocalculus sp. MSAO_Arc2]